MLEEGKYVPMLMPRRGKMTEREKKNLVSEVDFYERSKPKNED